MVSIWVTVSFTSYYLTNPIDCVAFSPDGLHIAAGGRDGRIGLWTADGILLTELKGHNGPVNGIAFSPDGTFIASGGDDSTVRLWTLDGNPAAEPFKGSKNGSYHTIAFSPDGKLIAAAGVQFVPTFNRVGVFSRDGKLTMKRFERNDGGAASDAPSRDAAFGVAFSPDGTRIVSGGLDGMVELRTLDGKLVGGPFKADDRYVNAVTFSPDGKLILSGGRTGIIRLWTLDGILAGEFNEPGERVRAVAFSPNGSHILSGGGSGMIHVWTLDGKSSTSFKAHDGAVGYFALSPDGTRIVSGGVHDGTVRLWTFDGKPVGRGRPKSYPEASGIVSR